MRFIYRLLVHTFLIFAVISTSNASTVGVEGWHISNYDSDTTSVHYDTIYRGIEIRKQFQEVSDIGEKINYQVTVMRGENESVGSTSSMDFFEVVWNDSDMAWGGYTISLPPFVTGDPTVGDVDVSFGRPFGNHTSVDDEVFPGFAEVHSLDNYLLFTEGMIKTGDRFLPYFKLNVTWLEGQDEVTFIVGQKPSAVPLPAAIWMFGSALLGLVGFSRKKAHVAAA